MLKQLLGLSCATIVLVGCSGGTATKDSSGSKSSGKNGASLTSSSAEGAGPNAFLVGKWKGRFEMPKAAKDDPGAKMAEAMGDMFMDMVNLEFTETEFTFSMMGIPIKGPFEIDGVNITMTPKTIGGMTPEEFAKSQKNTNSTPVSLDKMKEPMKGVISPDKKSIRIIDEANGNTSGELVFEKAPEEKPKEVSKPTVKGVEAELVGKYVADMNSIDESKLTPEQKDQLPMMKAALGSATLVLSADNTFRMNLIMDVDGTWLATGGKLTLTPTKLETSTPNGGKMTSSAEILDFRVMDGGKTLEMFSKDGDPTFNFVRAD